VVKKLKFRKNETVKIPFKREFKLFFTNKTMLSVFFIAPIFYALLMGFTYEKGKVTIFL
jgi:ABC-2 type transport system permease protein